MSDREDWGPWVEHDLSGCPVKDGEVVEVFCVTHDLPDGASCVVRIGHDYPRQNWDRVDELARRALLVGKVRGIVRYRVKKPRALQQLREMIETLPATRQKEDA